MDDTQRLTTEAECKIYNNPTINKIAGTYTGAVRIIGSGKTLWEDYAKSQELMPGTDTIAVNLSAMVIPLVTHLFSWHHKQIGHIKGWRRAEWCDEKSIVHSVKEGNNIDWAWRFNGGTSVSGLSAIDLAWLLGYRRIALVGIPMDNNGYFCKPYDNPDMHDRYRHGEIRYLHGFYKDSVRSFSGVTKDIMGEPTKQWLEEKYVEL